MINELSKQIHENAKNKGFYEGKKNIGEALMLCTSELSEALEADRENRYAKLEEFNLRIKQITDSYNGESLQEQKDNDFKRVFSHKIKDTFEDELADTMIRIMDLAAFKGIDLEKHIELKMKYNSLREYKHGKLY